MKTAALIGTAEGFNGDARLYRVNPAISFCEEQTEYVIVSASSVPYSGPETYIFPSSAEGEILDWGELPGSFKGEKNHERALALAGYVIQEAL